MPDPTVIASDLPGRLRDALRLVASWHRRGLASVHAEPFPTYVTRTFDDAITPEEADQLRGLGLVYFTGGKFVAHATDLGLEVVGQLEEARRA